MITCQILAKKRCCDTNDTLLNSNDQSFNGRDQYSVYKC